MTEPEIMRVRFEDGPMDGETVVVDLQARYLQIPVLTGNGFIMVKYEITVQDDQFVAVLAPDGD